MKADAEFVDYQFARFSKRIDVIRYTDNEYRELCTPKPEAVAKAGDDPSRSLDQDVRWDKEATDHLFELVRKYDLRWPVIYDRFELKPPRYLEDMKLRFYTVTARVLTYRRRILTNSQNEADLNTLTPFREYEGFVYNPADDNTRRKQLESSFKRTNIDLAEERRLLNELKGVETAIRRIESKLLREGGISTSATGNSKSSNIAGTEMLDTNDENMDNDTVYHSSALAVHNLALKKRGPYMFPSGDGNDTSLLSSATPTATGPRRGGTNIRQQGGMNPVAVATNPFVGVALRSSQLIAPIDGLHPDSATLNKVSSVLREAHLSDRPLPTAEILRNLTQLKREIITQFQHAKELKLVEEEVYSLQKLRDEATVNPTAMSMASAYTGQPIGTAATNANNRQQQRDQQQTQLQKQLQSALQQKQVRQNTTTTITSSSSSSLSHGNTVSTATTAPPITSITSSSSNTVVAPFTPVPLAHHPSTDISMNPKALGINETTSNVSLPTPSADATNTVDISSTTAPSSARTVGTGRKRKAAEVEDTAVDNTSSKRGR